MVRAGPQSLPIMCTVTDISEGGVGLTFVSIAGVPDIFMLEIKGAATVRWCRVAWRQEPHRLGVAFISEAGHLQSASPHLHAPGQPPLSPPPKGGDG